MPDRPRSRSSTRWLLAIGLVLLLAFGLRAHRLGADSVWWDEGFSVWMGRMPIPAMLDQTAHDAHPPLSYALLHGWIGLVGDEEFALRMQSVLFGVLTVAVAYQIGGGAGGRWAGLAGALLTAVMRLPVWWSQEVRMYAPAMLFAALGLWAALKLLTGTRWAVGWGVVLALSLGAGLLTLYLFAGVVIALNLAFLVAVVASGWDRKRAVAWIAAQIGALALFTPWAVYALPRLPSWESPYAPVTFWYVAKLYLSTVFLGIATDIDRYLWLLAGALAALAVAAVSAIHGGGFGTRPYRKRVAWMTLVITTVLPPVLVYLLSLPRGAFNYPTPSPRYFVLLSTPVYVLLGWGLTSAASSRRPARPTTPPSRPLPGTRNSELGTIAGAVLLAAMVALAGWSLADYYPGLRLTDDYPSMAATLEALRHPRDAVILNNDADWPIFDYHYPFDYSRHIPSTQRVRDEKYARDLLRSFRNDHQGVWLVQTRYAEVTDPDNYLGEWLAARSWNQQRYIFPEGQLWFFAVKPERGDPATMRLAGQWPRIFQPVGEVPIAGGARLAGFTQPVPEVRAGDLLVVGLGWQVDPGVQGEWPVAIRLIGPGGAEIASQMATLDGVGLPDGETRFLPVEVFIPPDAPDARAQIVFVAGETWAALDTIRIRARPAAPPQQATIPTSATPINVRFGDAITLLAVDLPDQTGWRPGEGIPLTLYWRAEGVIAERHKVFVHLIGEAYDPSDDSHIWGQQDQEPRNGASPTTAWRPGEVIADDYLVPIQPDAPPGAYRLQVGLYLPLGGQRLPAAGPDGEPLGDAVTVLEIEVGK